MSSIWTIKFYTAIQKYMHYLIYNINGFRRHWFIVIIIQVPESRC